MRLCWNGIVKNESARIERMLDSLGPFIDFVVAVDTGSTDDTKAKIQDWCDVHRIPCRLYDAIFENWSQARNAALAHARAVWCQEGQPYDYLLLVDADMQLVVKDRTCFDKLTAGAYGMVQKAGSIVYLNTRLVSANLWTGDNGGRPVAYVGVTHEYLDCAAVGVISEAQAYFLDHADGANRPEKFKRDIRLLVAALKLEPKNERYMFYLAQSYRDAGDFCTAAEWYRRRVEAGGWEEEVWQARVNMAACWLQLGEEGIFLREMLTAYNQRPSRAEALYDLAKHYREKGDNATAALFASGGLGIPLSHDALFVNEFVYRIGLKEELSIAGFYVPQHKALGFACCEEIAFGKHPHAGNRELARCNLFHYLEPLSKMAPSFSPKRIEVDALEGWAAMNPSIALWNGQLVMNVRQVNYRIDEQGRYLIRGTDGTANATNPINTSNVLLDLTDDLFVRASHPAVTPELPVEFPLVLGYEDLRLLPRGNEMYGSATVRQFHADGNCEQALVKLDVGAGDIFQIKLVRRMLRQPRETEKNWAPILHTNEEVISFMRWPGQVVDCYGNVTADVAMPWERTLFSGGSQLIPFNGGYLGIVHTPHHLPGSHLRYYLHHFIWYTRTLKPERLSRPFVLHEREIEYVAGMCLHPDEQHLVISYGRRDAEAWVATIHRGEVAALCGNPS